jgi:hypothetical protein
MPFSFTVTDRERDKFEEAPGNNTAVRVILSDAMRAPALSDAATVAYPSSTQEVYSFRSGGVAGSILRTLTVNYTDSTKENISSWFWA